MYEKVI